jgi:hypothetical protein
MNQGIPTGLEVSEYGVKCSRVGTGIAPLHQGMYAIDLLERKMTTDVVDRHDGTNLAVAVQSDSSPLVTDGANEWQFATVTL